MHLSELVQCCGFLVSYPILVFRDNRRRQRIRVEEICVLEAADNYVKVTRPSGLVYMVRATLEAVLSRLPEDKFARIHRSFAIGLEWLEMIEGNCVTLAPIPQKAFPISEKYSRDFFKKITFLDGGKDEERPNSGQKRVQD